MDEGTRRHEGELAERPRLREGKISWLAMAAGLADDPAPHSYELCLPPSSLDRVSRNPYEGGGRGHSLGRLKVPSDQLRKQRRKQRKAKRKAQRKSR